MIRRRTMMSKQENGIGYDLVKWGEGRTNTSTHETAKTDLWCRIEFTFEGSYFYISPTDIQTWMESFWADGGYFENAGAVSSSTTERKWTYSTKAGQLKAWVVRSYHIDNLYIKDVNGNYIFKGKNVK